MKAKVELKVTVADNGLLGNGDGVYFTLSRNFEDRPKDTQRDLMLRAVKTALEQVIKMLGEEQ